MRYFLSTPHWLNAYPPPLAPHLERLVSTVGELLADVARVAPVRPAAGG